MNTKKTVMISQSMFFPWVGFLEQISNADIYIRYDDVSYSKGSFTNRVQIFTNEKKVWLTLPIKNLKLGTKINSLSVDDSLDWKKKHIDLIYSNYKTSKFYKDVMEVVNEVYSIRSEKIADISFHSIKSLLKYFNIKDDIKFYDSKNLFENDRSSERVLNLVKYFKGNTYLTGHGATNYLNHDLFERNNINVEYISYSNTNYNQKKKNFDPYVSSLDLIANEGKKGINFIKGGTIYWKDFI